MSMAQRGKLVLLNGPSGSGKGSLLAYARAQFPALEFSVSCTTRLPRPGEREGVNYFFVSVDAFKERIAAGEFLEWAQYGGNYYGTLKSEVEERLAQGKIIILEIEIQGVHQIQALLPSEDLLTIYIDAGSWEKLSARITARAPIAPEELEKRRTRYEEEVHFKDEADVVIENQDGGLEAAQKQFTEVLAPLFVPNAAH